MHHGLEQQWKTKIPPQNWKKIPTLLFCIGDKVLFFVRVPTLKLTLIILVVITCRAAFHVTWARLESKSQPLCEIHLILVLKHSYFQMMQSTCLTGNSGRKIPYSSQNGRRNFLTVQQNYSLTTQGRLQVTVVLPQKLFQRGNVSTAPWPGLSQKALSSAPTSNMHPCFAITKGDQCSAATARG